MIPLTLAEVAAAVGGRLAAGAEGATTVRGAVVADSRAAAPGDLFVALPGERVDGHAFAAAAAAAGAVAALAGRDVGVPCVIVDDPLDALGRLASAVVARLPELTVVAVTGSSGKTSTKDLLAALLPRAGATVAPQGSHNNELGVPLTALRADAGSRWLVAEMGARRPGNIAYLVRMVRPRIGVVLNVGAAHLGVFGDRETTAQSKGELVEGLPADGVAVLAAGDARVAAMAARTAARVVWTAVGDAAAPTPAAVIRADEVRLDGEARASFRLMTPAGAAPVTLALHGAHQVGNALAAAAVALEAGLDVAAVADGLTQARPASRWRMEVADAPGGVTVVNDAYNANPDSVAAALRALAAMAAPRPQGRRRAWAVLGEMLELGESSRAEHQTVGRLAAELGIDRVLAVGAGAVGVRDGAAASGAEAAWAADPDEALAALRERLRPGDVVLVKASRSIGLERLAAELLRPAAAAARSSG